ncbi:MAG TPA: DUF4382 domain-containing protein [Steroidobacteraceae bacterium]|nr:DUF4382 domain-containing protein [Steroidobacteraceae bacterium]
MNTVDSSRRCRGRVRGFCMRLALIAGICGALTLGACSGGGSMNGSMSPGTGPGTGNTGMAMVTLTDAPGDLLGYMVNVVSLKLTRADGTAVETVPRTTTVDFAQLVKLAEVISAQQVPAGVYTGVSMTLDYASANIVVDNGAGGLTVPAANIINGVTMAPLLAPNSQMTLSVQLPATQPLIITNGSISRLALDFNLSASNSVAPSAITSATMASAVTVTVNPVLVGSLIPDTTRQIRVRGSLVSVTDTAAQTSYTVMVAPFFAADQDDKMGQVVVHTTAATVFTINGTSYTGNAGLAALAALATGTLTVAYGSFDTGTDNFTASQVFAGSSVPGAGLDSAEGTIVARSGNTLTLSSGFLEPRAGTDVQGAQVMAQSMGATSMSGGGDGGFGFFGGQVAVTVAGGTTVTEDGQSGSFGPQDISVGQHVQVFGKFGIDSSGNRTLDASAGSVRMMITALWGQFSSVAGGVVTVNLVALDDRNPGLFNFAGTGTSSAGDATVGAYTVSVPAALALPTIPAGFPIVFNGFVSPFGSAPPDFAALTLVDFTHTDARLQLQWTSPGITAPFVAPLNAGNAMMTQATLQSAVLHSLRIGPVPFDPASVSAGVSFVPGAADSSTSFAIAHRMSWQLQAYGSFGDFIAALNGDLNGTTALLAVFAQGPYDEATGVMTVNEMAVVLND